MRWQKRSENSHFCHFHPYFLSSTISFCARESPLAISSPSRCQSVLRRSYTDLPKYFPKIFAARSRASVMVGGRAKDLISSARRWTSASVGSLGFSGSRAEAADPEPASYQYTRLPPPSSCGSWRRPHEISVEPRQLKRKVKRWEGQRPRCPCNDESGSGDAAPPGPAAKRPMTK